MNILVDHSGYALVNLGDVAMLQVATRRLLGLWPGASLRVLTESPERLERFCPGATPVESGGLSALQSLGYLPGKYRLAGRADRPRRAVEGLVRRKAPGLLDALAVRRAGTSRVRASVLGVLDAVAGADLFVVSGGGFFTDAFEAKACRTLELLGRVARRGLPAAMLGQGIGPVTRPVLRESMRRLFPSVARFGLREGNAGPGLLRTLGVPDSRVAVTGDDAIELARDAPAAPSGGGLGINVREAAYAGLGAGETRALGAVLQRIARGLSAPIVPVPITRSGEGEDGRVFDVLLEGWNGPVEDGGAVETPSDAVSRAARCRLVIAGSYHAAVFALSRGIPAIGLVRSDYYAGKFRGLAGMFGEGCEISELQKAGWEAELEARARRLWDDADRIGPGLRDAAARQTEQGRNAYALLRELA